MSEKKLSPLDKLKAAAEKKFADEDIKLSEYSLFANSKTNDNNEILDITSNISKNKNFKYNNWLNDGLIIKNKTYQKNIAIDNNTKAMLDELAENGMPINASALFRKAVWEFYKEWKK